MCFELTWVGEKWALKGGGSNGGGPEGVGGPKFRAFFPCPAAKFVLFFPLWGSSRGILVVFEAPGGSNVRVWALGLSCASPGGPNTQIEVPDQNGGPDTTSAFTANAGRCTLNYETSTSPHSCRGTCGGKETATPAHVCRQMWKLEATQQENPENNGVRLVGTQTKGSAESGPP